MKTKIALVAIVLTSMFAATADTAFGMSRWHSWSAHFKPIVGRYISDYKKLTNDATANDTYSFTYDLNALASDVLALNRNANSPDAKTNRDIKAWVSDSARMVLYFNKVAQGTDDGSNAGYYIGQVGYDITVLTGDIARGNRTYGA